VTERLYYTDPYLVEFDANVVGLEAHERRPAAVLDRTAFYPTSGGQPCDVGWLGDTTVLDVVDRDDGVILHVLEREIPPGTVHGVIDWTRRFDHMQQHTGQHVLSAAFDRVVSARTESFHLGSVSSTIDLNRVMTQADVDRVEDEANRIVWENRPVNIRFVDAEDATKLPLRKESARTGRLRIIDVEGFDVSACGGTHVSGTGAIGSIFVRSTEKFRGGTRVEFLCGARALRGYRELRTAIDGSIRLLSVLPPELPTAIERLQGDMKATKRQLSDLQGRLAEFEADALAARAEQIGSAKAVIAALEGWEQQALKAIASTIAARPQHVAVLFGLPAPSAVVVARSSDLKVDSAAILKKLIERFGGKGGGRPELAQGGGLQGSPEDLIGFARSTCSSA